MPPFESAVGLGIACVRIHVNFTQLQAAQIKFKGTARLSGSAFRMASKFIALTWV